MRSSLHPVLPHNPAQVQQQSPKKERPETKCVKKRKGNVPCPDLQRHDCIHNGKNKWHDTKENHRCSMHGNQFVEDLCRYKIIHRLHQLNPNQNGFNAADSKEKSTRNQIENGDFL